MRYRIREEVHLRGSLYYAEHQSENGSWYPCVSPKFNISRAIPRTTFDGASLDISTHRVNEKFKLKSEQARKTIIHRIT